MRATDVVRSVLDLLDQIDNNKKIDVEVEVDNITDNEQASRFKQIFAMLDAEDTGPYSNTPNEVVSDVDSVTTDAGGGVNGPKHPDDIRVKDPRGYS